MMGGPEQIREIFEKAKVETNSEIPPNFRMTKGGVEFLEDTEDSTEWSFVCSPLRVEALTRNEDGHEWGRLLIFPDQDGSSHQWAMPMEMMAGDGVAYRERLLEQGLIIAPGRKARERLHSYISGCHPSARARAVSRLGWHGTSFVLPDTAFGETSTERTLYQTAHREQDAFKVFGTLREWRREVAAFCVSNSRLSFVVSAAFAAPLLYPTDGESGGFNLVGQSSLGKTTALRVAGSVWGGSNAPAGYLRQWRATANGLEGVAALHCDSLLCLDEISQVSGKDAGEVAYLLANGQGKARARRDGSARAPFDWRVLFLSTGEITLADKMREDGRQRATAGQHVRVIDIPANADAGLGLFENLHGVSDGQKFADKLRVATRTYYGIAARTFLGEVVKDPEKVAEAIRTCRDDFIEKYSPTSADGQVQRAATRFGLVAAAGELATALQITGWKAGNATWAAGVCFEAWLTQRGHIGSAEIEDGIERVRRFFALHGESRFSSEDHDETNGRPTINRAGFHKDGHLGVFPTIFRTEIAAGFEWHSLAAALVERGMLIAGTDGKIQRPVRNPENGKPIRMLCFSPTVLGEEERDDEA